MQLSNEDNPQVIYNYALRTCVRSNVSFYARGHNF